MQKFKCAACDKNTLPSGSKLKYMPLVGRRARVCAECAKRMSPSPTEKKEAGASD